MDLVPQLFVNALITASIYALVAAGFSLTYSVLKILNFAHGHLMLAGAYLFYLFSVELQLGVAAALLAAAMGTMVLAAAALVIFITPFERCSRTLPIITTLALATIIESTLSMAFGVDVKSFAGGASVDSIEIGSAFITPFQIALIVSAFSIISAAAYVLHATSFGRQVRAVSENFPSAQALSLKAPRIKLAVFLIGALFSMFAGIMIGSETHLQPAMGHGFTMKALAAMILGGLGNLWGAIAGCCVLGFVETFGIGLDFGAYSIPAGYKDAVAYLIILIVLLVRPEGLVSFRRRTA